jgi:hypothetical protein
MNQVKNVITGPSLKALQRSTSCAAPRRWWSSPSGAIVDNGLFDELMVRNRELVAMVQLMQRHVVPLVEAGAQCA